MYRSITFHVEQLLSRFERQRYFNLKQNQMNKILRIIQIYLKRQDKKTSLKKREEKVNAIVKSIMVDKTPKQAIQMLSEVVGLFDSKLYEQLKVSLESVEVINNYKK